MLPMGSIFFTLIVAPFKMWFSLRSKIFLPFKSCFLKIWIYLHTKCVCPFIACSMADAFFFDLC